MIVLPWHNPVLLAEQAATIDLLSGGRLEFGVGKGYRHNEFASFCIPQEEADERFEEGLALIIKSWTSNERFSHHGKYWHFENIIVEPPTAQKPHPPIWMAAGSPDSIRKVARRGCKLLLDQLASTQLAIERFNIYKAEVEACGRHVRPDGCRRQPRLLCRQERRGQGQGDRGAARQPARLAKLAQTPDGNSKSSMLSFDQTLDAAGESAMFGTPDEIAAKLRHAARRRHRACAAERPDRLAREPPRLRPRRHAGVRRTGARAVSARQPQLANVVVHKPVSRRSAASRR